MEAGDVPDAVAVPVTVSERISIALTARPYPRIPTTDRNPGITPSPGQDPVGVAR
jgi:hypothetical protein